MQQIENYKIVPVGRAKDLTNQIFGDFKVIYRTENPNNNGKQTFWLCQCQKCKKYYIKNAYILLNGTNECECKYDLTGQRIGRWTVLYAINERTKNRQILYHCKCECGNEKNVDAYTLRSGQSKSCGCLNLELAKERLAGKNKIDLIGQRFGKLVALYPIYSENRNVHTKWHCKCDCGNECDVDMGNLRSGKTQSCGCTHSKQEENIIKLLTQNQIPFNYQYRFNNLQNVVFDFFVNNEYIIEFDGQQHFNFTNTGWDTRDHFERTRRNDLLKNKYCFEHNIPLIRIPYNEEYTINDLKLETTRFLLTPEKEENYYSIRS